jgi:uncharacterized protein (TIGR02246 family)
MSLKTTYAAPAILTAAALCAALFVPLSSVQAEEKAAAPAARAIAEYELSKAVAAASREWREAFNRGDAAAAAAMYEEDAVMVAAPFGTFTGRAEIQAFWEGLVQGGYDDIIYRNTQTVVAGDLTSAVVSADWAMNNAHGVITHELWVLQPDGTARLREDHFEVAQ